MSRRLALRFLLAALLPACLLLFAGCDSGGDDDDGDGDDLFLRFRANGTQMEFTNPPSLLATTSQSGTQHVMIVTGFDAASGLSLSFFGDAPISERTYTGYTLAPGNVAFVGVLIAFHDAQSQYGPDVLDHTATITDITETTVEGTFQGTLSAAGRPDLVVTDGRFRVQRNPAQAASGR